MRLEGKKTVIIGAGQTPGETVGNGRATALTFGREGAQVMVVDRDFDSAEETAELINAAGGSAFAHHADALDERSVAATIERAKKEMGRVDVLHNNVGVSIAAGDAPVTDVEADAFDRVVGINLRTAVLGTKHVLPVMREQGSGVILYTASLAAIIDYPNIAYKTAKAGVVALMQNVAITNAPFGIRANALLPGLMNTPMAIESRVGLDGLSRHDVVALRDAVVPLRQKMGTGWDVANAALYLASDEAGFVTGVTLAIDGGQALRVG